MSWDTRSHSGVCRVFMWYAASMRHMIATFTGVAAVLLLLPQELTERSTSNA